MNDSTDEFTHLRVKIEGQVQGVGYRDFVVDMAMRMGVRGWIRNRSDGTVEALVSGKNNDVERLIGQMTLGPKGARVASYELHRAEPANQPGFNKRPTL
jgi:acylphosphatase